MASADAAAVSQADHGFVVVSSWGARSGEAVKSSYDYQHCDDLSAALDIYREYEAGEYARAAAVGIFEVKNGLPIAEALSPARLLQLMSETRNAA